MGKVVSYNRFLEKKIEKRYGKLDRNMINRMKANFSMIPLDQLIEDYWGPDELDEGDWKGAKHGEDIYSDL